MQAYLTYIGYIHIFCLPLTPALIVLYKKKVKRHTRTDLRTDVQVSDLVHGSHVPLKRIQSFLKENEEPENSWRAVAGICQLMNCNL